nr:hypothetical protein [Pseudomonas yamanorum]
MTKLFDMELFLAGVLTGSHATRQRHLHQAKAIQKGITERWGLNNPWSWKLKHLKWFITYQLKTKSKYTHYYYLLTMNLIADRLGKNWKFSER